MKKMTRTFAVVALVASLAVVTGIAGTQRAQTKIKGQIIGYRPAERVSQVASQVLNKESFLFKVSTAESNTQPVVTKVVYEHFGYSDLGEDVLNKTPTLQLSARRDATCDETYGAFVQNSPTLTEEKAKDDSGAKVIFIGSFQTMKLSPEQPLKCYKLQSGNFRIEPSTPSH
jgi:hypothetical protein